MCVCVLGGGWGDGGGVGAIHSRWRLGNGCSVPYTKAQVISLNVQTADITNLVLLWF